MISLDLKGVKGLQKAIKDKESALTKGIDAQMAASVAEINAQQKALAPVDFGTLRSSLKFTRVAQLDYEIVSTGAGSEYAPYQEFGTGGLTVIPQGLEKEAAQFKGKGGRQVNMRPQPFFFAPAFKEFRELKKRIEQLLAK
jgi:HK97 gp10 family phage protein